MSEWSAFELALFRDFCAGMSLAEPAAMRIVSLFLVSVAASALALVGCGGATTGSDGTGTPGPASTSGTGSSGRIGATAGSGDDPGNDLPQPGTGTNLHPPTNGQGPGTVGATCASPTSVSVAPGGVIARPVGSALRLQLTYQGTDIGVTDARGVDMTLAPADGPFTPGKVAGYWVEARSGKTTTYQHLFEDPTTMEAVGPGGEGFMNLPIDRCTPKLILADVPNDPSTTDLVIFGSPYGTNDGAVELGHFTIK